jgi:hypothetical protein
MMRGTALTLPVNNTSSQTKFYAALPTAQNQPCECVLVEDAVEPGYPLPSTANPGSNPATGLAVNGTTPNSPYDLRKRSFAAARHGRVFCIAYDGNILQGDLLIIADSYGRVQRAGALASGTQANIVGRALHPSTAQNDLVAVDLLLGTSRQ